jgi:hypothetical protein
MAPLEVSNEQKLTYIYETLKAEEQRRKHRRWLRVLKWILLISVAYLVFTYKAIIMEKSYEYVSNRIRTEMKRVSEEQKSSILRGVQELLPEDLSTLLKKEEVKAPIVPTQEKKPAPKTKENL